MLSLSNITHYLNMNKQDLFSNVFEFIHAYKQKVVPSLNDIHVKEALQHCQFSELLTLNSMIENVNSAPKELTSKLTALINGILEAANSAQFIEEVWETVKTGEVEMYLDKDCEFKFKAKS
jgi:hypothetical protein